MIVVSFILSWFKFKFKQDEHMDCVIHPAIMTDAGDNGKKGRRVAAWRWHLHLRVLLLLLFIFLLRLCCCWSLLIMRLCLRTVTTASPIIVARSKGFVVAVPVSAPPCLLLLEAFALPVDLSLS
jgi:hypothetical protein